VNTLALMHYVTPLPEPLVALRPPETVSRPAGVGRGFIPLGSLTLRGRGARGVMQDLLYPPDWWMRTYYGVPPHRSLFAVRWGLHVWRIVYWIGRRLVASSMPRATASAVGAD
jgi:hypothetical protein